MAWVKENCTPPLFHLLGMAGERTCPGVKIVRKLVLPLASYSTQESGSCTWPGLNIRTDPVFVVTGDLNPPLCTLQQSGERVFNLAWVKM